MLNSIHPALLVRGFFFFSSRRRHTRYIGDWSSDVCSSDLAVNADQPLGQLRLGQDLFNRGRLAEAEPFLRKAAAWDPNSAGISDALGTDLNALDRKSVV